MSASGTEAHSQAIETASKDEAAYTILRPEEQTAAVVYASPHSGHHYPKKFVDNSPLDPVALRRSEDAFVHEIYESCTGFGSPLIKANYPRAYLDLNREPYELDPSMFDAPLPSYVNSDSPRALAGLGTVARMVTTGSPIYPGKLNFEEIDQRIKDIYHPYHIALRQLIENTLHKFGNCLLIDCHSMPSGVTHNHNDANASSDIVLGDRFGASCHHWITDHIHSLLEREGFSVKRNRPYAGGFTTQHYGRPDQGVHTLQIELNRALYMDEHNITRLQAMNSVQRHFKTVIHQISQIDLSTL
ncbi:N-formylglutamate amidohydrolase [Terasakiella sp. SH-1]|uniref:N-formylglutamate amidohydrolase n=1 Tax=Terasakiella sp. SH-1 TaxID=2560057 RepID=UPI0010733D59|nr:N-formylglutamate amidohydrolase [Terasakiella sp. SH-1]